MSNEIMFGGIERVPDVRMLYDMAEVVYDKKWLEGRENEELYYMYRDLSQNPGDLDKIKSHNLRYDITIIPPAMLGVEYVKTAGHYHPQVPGSNLSYAEVYQVHEGSATYLLQKVNDGMVEDVVVVKANAMDVVVVPPGYGHITINASDSTLKMANWVCRNFSSVYEPVKDKKGGAYYLLEDGFIQNPAYSQVPEIRHIKPRDVPEFGLFRGEDMYGLVEDLSRLEFLTAPEKYNDIFSHILNG
jgi:glucose-6-phosphate isomerase